MRGETSDDVPSLRSGYTTGACATATSLAAAMAVLGLEIPEPFYIRLPKGQKVAFAVFSVGVEEQTGQASTIKDAGDDPDVTHGARVFARVSLSAASGVRFSAAKGVGRVTRKGLSIAPGEPAINPVPRKMMTEHLQTLARQRNYSGGFEVAIGIEGGEALALKTMNGRLGIVGGLSILGTTGIVRPFSCSAYIASIHQGIDVARSNGQSHLLACTGSVSEQTAQRLYPMPDMALIEMGDFAGVVLNYIRRNPVQKLSLVGGFGKLCKLAQGAMDLHSKKSSIDMHWLAELADDAALSECTTSLELLSQAPQLGDRICSLALTVSVEKLRGGAELEIIAVDRQGHIVGRAGA